MVQNMRFSALSLALAMAKQNASELHMVCVEEIDYMPEFIEEVREETGTAARRFHTVLQSARATAEKTMSSFTPMFSPGIRCATSSQLAAELKVELLVIGATGHSALV